MEWEKLLSLKRFGDTFKRKRIDQDETRLGFEVDYDRIIFSSEFRSLQDKTQVVPFSQGDFVHTRLTHSLETSVVGRSLGRSVGVEILKKYPYLKDEFGYQSNDFGAIVASASLAHDIGNPPFGHSGEKSIGQYFISGPGHQFQKILNEKEFKDLCDFEGNANGFKILTQSRPGREGGIRLSYATLGTFVKYPKESLPVKPTANVADKKFSPFILTSLAAIVEVLERVILSLVSLATPCEPSNPIADELAFPSATSNESLALIPVWKVIVSLEPSSNLTPLKLVVEDI